MNDDNNQVKRSRWYEWHEIWGIVMRNPNTGAYQEILDGSDVSYKRARNWLFYAGFLTTFVVLFGQIMAISRSENYELNLTFQTLICSPIIGGAFAGVILMLLPFTIGTGITHFLAQIFGGKGTFAQLSFAVAASLAPMILISLLLLIIAIIVGVPAIATGGIVLLIPYALFQVLLATRTVYQFSVGKAIIPALAVMILVLFFGGILMMFSSLADPDYMDSVDKVFQDILNGMEAQ